MKKIKTLIYEYRMKKAIRKANEYHKLTGNKFLVVNVGGKLVVKSKKNLKYLIKTGVVNCSIQEIEELALYITK